MRNNNYFLITLLFVIVQLKSSAQSNKLLTNVYWEIPMHAMGLMLDSDIAYCFRIKDKDSSSPIPNVNGFIFYSDGRFKELVKSRCSRDRSPYSGKWVQRGDTIQVNINEQLYWYFKIKTLTKDHFRAQYWTQNKN